DPDADLHVPGAPFQPGGSWLAILGLSLLLFPKLALGLSGFETGVAVMPLVKGAPGEPADNPAGRVRNTRKLLLTAALIMSVFLPRYGMAPDWARAVRPLVLLFTAINLFVTWEFDADVDKQGAAYATGVLMLISSACVATIIDRYQHASGPWARRLPWPFVAI